MVDTLTPAERSERMGRVRSRHTKPELVVRQLVHGMGYRYRLHRRDLPGSPDLVFPGRRAVIFVHGCFWHRHDCKMGRLPKSRPEFWIPKLEANKVRDRLNLGRLEAEGWRVLVLWECELRDLAALAERIRAFLGGPGACNRSSFSPAPEGSASA
ncbi:DNA mismatch endonuclease (patch repair protein) [Azospirillum sp. OGB3]|uniref:very short patch repair endonuclease n=1 Tax=Azospirillum sp. OGB3 TaxID=2587012 RepID=UPI00182D6ED5|nr:DNA mismatch endonuclease Vsr [Azospirillum sp. OGB3]MBB3268553.1 DNA mismatch endonuclease (patch repair protein) [Azospirillum sp. OGB3]